MWGDKSDQETNSKRRIFTYRLEIAIKSDYITITKTVLPMSAVASGFCRLFSGP